MAATTFAGTWTDACLRVAGKVAEALQHAHERGVLHRDVKPGNVLVTPESRVQLVDFGLAAAEGSERLTSSGANLGSLAWMSPEQVRGEYATLDARSDVYSLGATFFELLALRTPFARGAVEDTRRRILEGRALPLRELNPAVPPDAETVCLKAMDVDRARRYAGAAAFAEDLQAALERRPVAARRPSAAHKAWRWAQRKPAAAAALVLGLLLLLAGPLGWELAQQRNREQLRRAAERSERNFQAVLQAIGHVLRDMASEDLEDVPLMQGARLLALDRELELFPALEADRPDDPLVLTEGSGLHLSRGNVLRDLGRPDEALAEFERAVELRRRLLEREPSPARRAELAEALGKAGKALSATFLGAEALPLIEESVAELRRAAAARPEDGDLRRRLTLALAEAAEAQRMLGRLEACGPLLEEALALVSDLRAQHPQSADVLWANARILDDRALLARLGGREEQSLDFGVRALESFRAAHAADPARRFLAFDVGTGLYSCALSARLLGRFDEAEAWLAEAAAINDGLLADFPEAERYRRRRMDILDVRAETAGRRGDHARAAELYGALLPERERLAAAEPGRCDVQAELARNLTNLANALLQLGGRMAEARHLAGDALARLRACEAAGALPPEMGGGLTLLTIAFYEFALATCQLDLLDEARTAVAEFEAHARGPLGLRWASDLWNEWILAQRRAAPASPAREAAEADACARMLAQLGRAIDAGFDDVAELRGNPALEFVRGRPEFEALVQRAQERHAGP